MLQVPGYIAADVVKQTFLLIQMKDLPGIAKYEAYQVFDRGSSCLEIAIRTQLYTPLPEYQKTHVLHREDIWQMARELCAALDAGWQRGLFHGHITPENVLVDQKGHFFLSDFGMAELTHRKQRISDEHIIAGHLKTDKIAFVLVQYIKPVEFAFA